MLDLQTLLDEDFKRRTIQNELYLVNESLLDLQSLDLPYEKKATRAAIAYLEGKRMNLKADYARFNQ